MEALTIPAVLDACVAPADAPWLFAGERSWTLAEAKSEIDRIAVGLAERGVGHGDRVAILTGNTPETIFVWLAANRLGAAAAPLNPALKPAELGGLLRLVAPKVLVSDAERLALAEAGAAAVDGSPQTLAPIAPGDLLRSGSGAPHADVRPDDVAILLGTSGTTGAPKAVMQTHRTYALTAASFPWWVGLGASDRVMLVLPLFHVNAQAYGVMGALGAGASLTIAPKFSASRFWDDVKRLEATQVNAVGAMIHILLKNEPRPAEREHRLRLCYSALALPEAQHLAFEERFGAELTVGYGLSESTFGTVWPRRDSGEPRPFGTMGRLRQHPKHTAMNRGRVVRDDGTDANDDETGELWLSNPAIMSGYFRDPAQTAAVRDGEWLKTGDLVKRDACGMFTFVARKKDVVRRRGENIAAAEIEVVLAAHESVLEAAVIGAPSELGEEDVVAFVVPRSGHTIEVSALLAWAKERLADYKLPSRVHVRESLPRTATERIAKHLLRET